MATTTFTVILIGVLLQTSYEVASPIFLSPLLLGFRGALFDNVSPLPVYPRLHILYYPILHDTVISYGFKQKAHFRPS